MDNNERDSKITETHTAVMVMAAQVKSHDNTLYGNGQPGLVKDVVLLKARNTNTISGKRLGVAYIMMIIAIIMAAVSIIGMFLK